MNYEYSSPKGALICTDGTPRNEDTVTNAV